MSGRGIWALVDQVRALIERPGKRLQAPPSSHPRPAVGAALPSAPGRERGKSAEATKSTTALPAPCPPRPPVQPRGGRVAGRERHGRPVAGRGGGPSRCGAVR